MAALQPNPQLVSHLASLREPVVVERQWIGAAWDLAERKPWRGQTQIAAYVLAQVQGETSLKKYLDYRAAHEAYRAAPTTAGELLMRRREEGAVAYGSIVTGLALWQRHFRDKCMTPDSQTGVRKISPAAVADDMAYGLRLPAVSQLVLFEGKLAEEDEHVISMAEEQAPGSKPVDVPESSLQLDLRDAVTMAAWLIAHVAHQAAEGQPVQLAPPAN